MPKVLREKIKRIENIAPGIFLMNIESGYIAENAKPGQFVNIKCCEGLNALLRRPISICRVDRSEGTFDIVFQVKGTGTEFLCRKQAGETVDLIGPLGNSFDIDDKYENIAVVGGGIGIFPLLFLLNEKKATKKTAFLGFRNKELIVLRKEFEQASDKLNISTDDGSEGYNGLITDLLEKDIVQAGYDMIYTCGPTPMIKKVCNIADSSSIKCQVSLEQRMGCGIGACLVCACKTKYGDDWEYSHVCKDGPVFSSSEVIFE
ncbi:MAG: dihydroorotate dehydrogenase electron transfer subunit [Bacillota bacterium]|nr:dihydroorotate dehydrogenase electron transfer subunit [Bacillota bacterium]